MSGARWRKVRADLLANKMRSGLAIVSLAVGTTAVGAMFLAGSGIDASFTSTLRAADPPSAMLVTEPFGPELVDEVAAHPAVGQVEGRRLHQVQMTAADGGRATVQLVAMADFADNDLARIEPTAGTWPPGPGSVVFERASLPELGLDIGETASVEVPGDAPVALTVSGTAFDAYEVAPMVGGPIRGYVALDTIAELTGDDDLDALYLRGPGEAPSREQAVAMTAAVRDEVLAPAGVAIVSTRIDEPGEHPAGNAVSFVTLAMQLLSLLGLAVAVGLVLTTVAALLAQQRTQLGVMKAIGATAGQLTVQYLAYVVLLALVAITLSVPAALASGRLVAGLIAGIVNIELAPMGVPVAVILAQVGIALLVPVAAVTLAVRRACRITVREAITDLGLAGSVRTRRRSVPFARPTVLAYRNAVRNRPRLGLTVLTVGLCGAVLVGVISTGSALGDLGDEVAGYDDYDLALALTEPVALDDAIDVLGDEAGVTAVEGWLQKQALGVRPDSIEHDTIDLVGVPPGSGSVAPTLLEGRWFEAADDHAIVINTHLADEAPGLGVGGQINLEVEGHRQRWEVVGISTTTLVGPVAYVPVGDLAASIDAAGQTNLLAVVLAADVDQTAAAEHLGPLALDAGLPVAGVQTNEALRADLDSIFTIVVALLLLVGAILAVVAVVGVAGTMTLGVVEQTREIGVLRTLGASTWTVRRLLLLQGLAVAAVGGLLGVLLSVPVSLLLGNAIGTTLISAEFPFSFSWFGVGIWAAVAATIGALGATQPARVASRLTIRDTLAYE